MVVALQLAGCQVHAPASEPAGSSAKDAALTTAHLPASEPLVTTVRNWPDVHSRAEPDRFVTRHFDLNLEVDFAARRLRGHVTLDVERVEATAREFVLDTRDLTIIGISTAPAGSEAFTRTTFTLDPRHEMLGSALRIVMPATAARVRIEYSTSPQASGLQWLEPAQTAGRRQPFLYSQAQSLHARSFVPLQDTPRVRATYSASLRVPAGLVAVMAAEPDAANARGAPVFRFRMPQPIPSYLLAVAVGDLAFAPIGRRTGVWAEPSVLEAAAWEFGDVEAMLERTEALYGPYRWGRYDVLVLPPSFPYGGMENPRLTFMTPTVIAGDKSLVGVLAHELAHSWSGNLVTNATWRDIWLNEGFTTYFERRIMEAVYGAERARMEWGVGLQDLRTALADLPPGQEWRGAMAPDLSTRLDEEGSAVAHELGALFLYQLEQKYGRAALDAFLANWFEDHAFMSVTTPQFLQELRDDLIAEDRSRIDDGFLRRWIDEPGLPADATLVPSDLFARVDEQRKRWESGELATAALETSRWTVQEWLQFLNGIERPHAVTMLVELDRRFALTSTRNAEVAHAWYRLALASGYPGLERPLERYLTGIGRLKLIRPLYTDLMKTPAGAQFARRVYATARPGYHAIAQRALDRVVK
jgi:leukotriene-A4 hydrolase